MNRKTLSVFAATSVIGLLTLTACSPAVKEVDEQSGMSEGSQSGSQSSDLGPQLDEARIKRVVDEVQAVLNRAQEENNPGVLKERLSSGALALREGQFTRSQKTGTEIDPLEIEVNVASSTVAESWPRVLVVGSSASSDDPAEVFVFTQESAQSDYMLENWVRAVGGNSVRGVAVENGSTALAEDAADYRLSPKETLQTYVNFLNDPDNEANKVFDDNTFAPRYRSDLDDLNSSVSKAGAVTANASVAEYPITSVSLTNGDALVSANFVYSHTYDRTVANSTMKVGGTAAAYMEDPTVIGTVKVDYLVSIFFTVPPKDSTEKIKVVGSERVITGVSKDDSAIPEGE